MRAVAFAAILLAFGETSALAQANRPVGAMTSGRTAKCYICGTAASASGLVNGVNLSWCASHARNPLRDYQGRRSGVLSVPARATGAPSTTLQTPRTGTRATSVRTSKAAAPVSATVRPVRRFEVGTSTRKESAPAGQTTERSSTGSGSR